MPETQTTDDEPAFAVIDGTTDVSAGRQIEAEIGWCADDPGYIGTLSYPPDGENPWTIMHEEANPSLEAVRSGLRSAIRSQSWPCRYCSDWMLSQTKMFLRNGVCEVCHGTKLIANTALPNIADLIEEVNNA